MSMIFSTLKGLTIPEGNVIQISDTSGVVLWSRIFTDDTDDIIYRLVDFEYTNNGDGTVTLTAWKGTLNGVASTELVIPDDSRIIL